MIEADDRKGGRGGLGFAASELFDRTFGEGMALVDDAAAYLDGPGRQASKRLGRDAALLYAGESMTLTTRLMQVASWLLVQRAVREGDMSRAEAADPRYRIGPPAPPAPAPLSPVLEPLPEGLIDLQLRTERLYERIVHLDHRLYLEGGDAEAPNPVLSQFARLRDAFGDVAA
jgi:regulator of CtrA degradation